MNITKYRVCLGILIIAALVAIAFYQIAQNKTEGESLEGTFVDNVVEIEKLL